LGHYLGMKKQDVWELTLPQLNYYLKKCHKHIEFTVKVHSMSFSGLFGGGGSAPSEQKGTYVNEDGKQVVDGYEVADTNDMEWLASIL
jgi:hypothetical protein